MGWMKGVAVGFMAIAVAFTATGAFAESRPVAFGPGTVGEPSLQEIFTDISGGTLAPNYATTGQTNYSLFNAGPVATVATNESASCSHRTKSRLCSANQKPSTS